MIGLNEKKEKTNTSAELPPQQDDDAIEIKIPVRITVLVPVSAVISNIPEPDSEINDHRIVDITNDEETQQAVLKAANDDPAVIESLAMLFSAAEQIKKKYPQKRIRAWYSPCDGIIPENEI